MFGFSAHPVIVQYNHQPAGFRFSQVLHTSLKATAGSSEWTPGFGVTEGFRLASLHVSLFRDLRLRRRARLVKKQKPTEECSTGVL